LFLTRAPRSAALTLRVAAKQGSASGLNWCFLEMEHHSECVVARRDFVGVECVEFRAQGVRRGEAVGDRVGVGEFRDVHLLDPVDGDVTRAGYVAPLAFAHHAILPEADRLGLFAGTDRGQKFFLEQKHGIHGSHRRAGDVSPLLSYARFLREAYASRSPIAAKSTVGITNFSLI